MNHLGNNANIKKTSKMSALESSSLVQDSNKNQQDASPSSSSSPQLSQPINKTLQETPGFRMRKFNKNKRFKENYFEMRMMDSSPSMS